MRLRVKIAETDEERDALYRARHRCYVGGGFFQPQVGGRICDRFDAFGPDVTVNIMALCGDTVVGGLRLIHSEPFGTSSDAMFDFGPYLGEGRSAATSMMFVDPQYQNQGVVIVPMTNMLHHVVDARSVAWTFGCVTTAAWPWVRKLGAHACSEAEHVTASGLPFVPYKFGRHEYNDHFLGYIRQHHLGTLFDVWDRWALPADDALVGAGEFCDRAWVVTAGSLIAEEDGLVVAFGVGDLVGAEELTSGRRWKHGIKAGHLGAEVLAIDRDTYFDKVRHQPASVVRLASFEDAKARARAALMAHPVHPSVPSANQALAPDPLRLPQGDNTSGRSTPQASQRPAGESVVRAPLRRGEGA